MSNIQNPLLKQPLLYERYPEEGKPSSDIEMQEVVLAEPKNAYISQADEMAAQEEKSNCCQRALRSLKAGANKVVKVVQSRAFSSISSAGSFSFLLFAIVQLSLFWVLLASGGFGFSLRRSVRLEKPQKDSKKNLPLEKVPNKNEALQVKKEEKEATRTKIAKFVTQLLRQGIHSIEGISPEIVFVGGVLQFYGLATPATTLLGLVDGFFLDRFIEEERPKIVEITEDGETIEPSNSENGCKARMQKLFQMCKRHWKEIAALITGAGLFFAGYLQNEEKDITLSPAQALMLTGTQIGGEVIGYRLKQMSAMFRKKYPHSQCASLIDRITDYPKAIMGVTASFYPEADTISKFSLLTLGVGIGGGMSTSRNNEMIKASQNAPLPLEEDIEKTPDKCHRMWEITKHLFARIVPPLSAIAGIVLIGTTEDFYDVETSNANVGAALITGAGAYALVHFIPAPSEEDHGLKKIFKKAVQYLRHYPEILFEGPLLSVTSLFLSNNTQIDNDKFLGLSLVQAGALGGPLYSVARDELNQGLNNRFQGFIEGFPIAVLTRDSISILKSNM